MLISTPAAIRSSTALNSSRSTVNHQEAKSPRSLRLISMSVPLYRHLDARQSGDRFAEGISPDFKIRIVVERCTGGRQEHDGTHLAVLDGVTCGRFDRLVERAGLDVRLPVADLACKF